MLRLTVVFFVIAVLSGLFAFGDIEPTMELIIKTIFFIASGLFLLSLLLFPQRNIHNH